MRYKGDKERKNDVISLRLNEERIEVLERHRQALMEQLHRPVSLSEAAFLVIDDRVETVEREIARYELLKNPAESLWRIRRQWEAEHTLSVAEWDLLAIYLQIGAEEQRQVLPVWRPAAPCRESFLALVEAFASLLRSQKKGVFGKHLWYYFANLDGHNSGISYSEADDAEQSYEAVLRLLAMQKEQLQSEEDWKYPGSVGRCLLTAIQSEPESRRIDQALAPYWNVLWRIAARGHWLRHHLPVRIVQPDSFGPAERPKFPDSIETRNLLLSFRDGGGDIAFYLEFRPPRSFTYSILHYPELIEFHAMLEEFGELSAWNGRYFRAIVTTNEDSGETKYTLWPKQQDIEIAFTDKEWLRLRDLFRQAWEKPEITERMAALQLEYGEQG
jgi:hypothetical protein